MFVSSYADFKPVNFEHVFKTDIITGPYPGGCKGCMCTPLFKD